MVGSADVCDLGAVRWQGPGSQGALEKERL